MPIHHVIANIARVWPLLLLTGLVGWVTLFLLPKKTNPNAKHHSKSPVKEKPEAPWIPPKEFTLEGRTIAMVACPTCKIYPCRCNMDEKPIGYVPGRLEQTTFNFDKMGPTMPDATHSEYWDNLGKDLDKQYPSEPFFKVTVITKDEKVTVDAFDDMFGVVNYIEDNWTRTEYEIELTSITIERIEGTTGERNYKR